jgi:1-acyl-sn-glycerol-3-phosphate acyltransferase
MQDIIVAKPYKFIPPRYSAFWSRLIQWWLPTHLRKGYGITSWEFRNLDRLKASLDAGHGVLLAPNHCRPCDPQVLALLSREVRRPFHIMASWHVFMQNRVQNFILPRIGGFSVYREGLDRESLKCATHTLTQARFPLVLFPEGMVSRNNDRLLNLMDGVSFLARTAAKQRAAASPPGKVVLHPVFLRYFFEGDLATAVEPVMCEVETRLSWQPQTHLPLRDRMRKAGVALLALKEMEYLGAPQSGEASVRLPRLLDHLLAPLEKEWTAGRNDGDTMARVKRLRSAILSDLVNGELSEAEKSRRWRHFADLYLAQQLICYTGEYIIDENAPERMLETAERFEEDLTDVARPHLPMRVAICVGEAINVAPSRDRHAESDPIIDDLRSQLEAMMVESRGFRRIPISHPSTP